MGRTWWVFMIMYHHQFWSRSLPRDLLYSLSSQYVAVEDSHWWHSFFKDYSIWFNRIASDYKTTRGDLNWSCRHNTAALLPIFVIISYHSQKINMLDVFNLINNYRLCYQSWLFITHWILLQLVVWHWFQKCYSLISYYIHYLLWDVILIHVLTLMTV